MLCVGIVTGGLLAAAGCGKSEEPSVAVDRETFHTVAMGETGTNLMKRFGRPYLTDTGPGGEHLWWYQNVSYDPISGSMDRTFLKLECPGETFDADKCTVFHVRP